MFMYTWVYLCIQTHMEVRDQLYYLLPLLFTSFFEAGSLTDPGVHQFSETGWPWNSKVLPLWESPALESECMPPHPALHMNSGDLNLGPDAYAASTLPADPSEAARPYHC